MDNSFYKILQNVDYDSTSVLISYIVLGGMYYFVD